MRQLLLAAVLLVLTPAASFCQGDSWKLPTGKTIGRADLISFLQMQKDSLQITGLSFAIIMNGKLTFDTALGVRDNRTNVPIDRETLFESASLTKPFFSYAVIDQVLHGKLSLDTPLHRYLPHPNLLEDKRHQLVTARMVLSHHSGLPNWRDSSLRFVENPDTKYIYSGEGMEWLGKALRAVTNTNLDTLLQQVVLKRFDMTHSSLTENEWLQAHMALGHRTAKEPGRQIIREAHPAYGLRSNAREFARLLEGWIREKKDPNSVFSAQTVLQKQLKTDEWVCLGIFQERTSIGIRYQHTGNNSNRFTSIFEIYPDTGFGFVFFLNSAGREELSRRLHTFLGIEK